jgi:hypothetical protein
MPDCANTPEYTTFQEVYDAFTSGITDDMFMEMTKEDTDEILEELLMAALPHFEFPRQDIFNLDRYNKRFKCLLTAEEIRIIRSYMVVEWINYQLASIENVRQKYSGSDFSFTSQASHMDKLIKLRETYKDEGFKLQRLYKRRRRAEDGSYTSTFRKIMSKQPRKFGDVYEP